MGPVDCQRTLWRITDDIAAIDPHRLFCTQPVSSDISQGWRDISFSDMASAANRMALWLQENVASSTQQETLAYVGTNDIRYVAFILACMKLRHKVSTEIRYSGNDIFNVKRKSIGATSFDQELGCGIPTLINFDWVYQVGLYNRKKPTNKGYCCCRFFYSNMGGVEPMGHS